MFVLALDCSSPAVLAAVVRADRADDAGVAPVATAAPLAARGHGELLAPSIAAVLADAALAPRDIGAVVAGVGPGPFTGLRVGIVTAAAFADAIGAPAYGVCSLDAIATPDEPGLLVVADARRREVYWARYEHGVRAAGPSVDRPDEVPLDGVTAVAGAGAQLYPDAWAQLPVRPGRYPDPQELVRLALERVRGHAPSETLTPLYLRRPDAVVPGAPKDVTPKDVTPKPVLR